MQPQPFDVLLFDLGGVLVETIVLQRVTELSRNPSSVYNLTDRWASIPVVRDFDLGRTTPEKFAVGMVQEFDLPLAPDIFLQSYGQWIALYPETLPLLERLSQSFTLAVLSNSNELHWARMFEEWGLGRFFSHTFASFQTGLLKPEKHTYLSALASLGCSPERVLFFDDHQPNVEGAISAGITSFKVLGAKEVASKLEELALI